ncbi:inosine/xanthosine triphosphatase [Wenzhouxiangellaceae bacterium CH-27]|uniref:Inosine/xanthosine triphosphatase n=2 Tax=Elongatibacter sediminis TaxID=3119006 RepID=A0AAW9RFZ5_9GAMM
MRIVVASNNPVKLRAVELAFGRCFAGSALELQAVSVASGVSEQPMSDQETRRGARNRAAAARDAMPDADYWVGLEGGLESLGDALYASAWMTVIRADGASGNARTPTLPLPPAIADLIASGMELGDANDAVFGTTNSKQGSGAFGLLTGQRLTRESVYAETLTLALIPLIHELWSGGTGHRRVPPPSSDTDGV